MEKKGIKGIKAITSMALAVGNAVDAAIDKETEGIAKALPFLALSDELIALMSVEWSGIKDEYLDMDSDEKAELSALMKNKFDIKSDRTEEIIEKSLDLALKLEGIVKESVLLIKSLRAESENEQ